MNHSALRDDRPAPIQLHDGIVVPGVLCAELAAALDLLHAFVTGAAPPAACRPARLPRAALVVRQVARDAAVEYQAQLARRSVAAARASVPVVLTAARGAAVSGVEEMTTAQAATLAGVTEARIRQLAAAGTIAGRKASRDVWLLDPASVRAYREQRRRTA